MSRPAFYPLHIAEEQLHVRRVGLHPSVGNPADFKHLALPELEQAPVHPLRANESDVREEQCIKASHGERSSDVGIPNHEKQRQQDPEDNHRHLRDQQRVPDTPLRSRKSAGQKPELASGRLHRSEILPKGDAGHKDAEDVPTPPGPAWRSTGRELLSSRVAVSCCLPSVAKSDSTSRAVAIISLRSLDRPLPMRSVSRWLRIRKLEPGSGGIDSIDKRV